MFDLIIVGGGPAGAAAAVYAARKKLRTVMVTGEWGGQSNVSADIHNWIGTVSISGADLAKNLKAHVDAHVGDSLNVVSPAWATKLETFDDHVAVTLSNNTVLEGKTLLIASGSNRRKLEVPGAKEFDNKGLTYCATCDGPLFTDQDVCVIGGGNAAFESALQLVAYCKHVTLLNRSEEFRADEVTVEAAKKIANLSIITSAVPTKVLGEQFVTGYVYTKDGKEVTLPVTGIFVEIGLLPNTDWLNGTIGLTGSKHVKVDPRSQRASHPRVWAAGDVTDGLYHQNNIAAGDAVKALEDIYMSLHKDLH